MKDECELQSEESAKEGLSSTEGAMLQRLVMKDLATKETPTEDGLYLWWDEREDKAPFHVLARVRVKDAGVVVNFTWDTDYNNYQFINDVAPRLWLKVS